VLVKVSGRGVKDMERIDLVYGMIDYFDEENNMTSMMRTTGFPVSIIAQMIEKGLIRKHGVFCCEEIIPCKLFFEELEKRGIHIRRKINHG
ncbi:MAG: saccharopine dehydrogenase, partial [Thermoplasmata archaeon]